MLKYIFKVFDENDQLIIQTIVPASDMWEVLNELKNFGVVKGSILDENSN